MPPTSSATGTTIGVEVGSVLPVRAASKRFEVVLLRGSSEVFEHLDEVSVTRGFDQPVVHRGVVDLTFDAGETGLVER